MDDLRESEEFEAPDVVVEEAVEVYEAMKEDIERSEPQRANRRRKTDCNDCGIF